MPERAALRGGLAALALALVATLPVRAEPVPVEVTNASEPVLCAEKDNVTINLTAPQVRSFRIEATHPAYMAGIGLGQDSFAADWTACDMSGDPVHKSDVKAPTRRTLYEEPDLWLVGWTFPTYWRPSTASVRIGDRIEKGVHLVQVWRIRPMGGEEVLVVYPQDGYWRARPFAPVGRAATAFGSSFLVGPVEVDGRPIVRFKEIAFDPKSRTFSLSFATGGSGRLRLAETDHARTLIEVALDQAITGRPFAALRSMYVTATNNDVAAIAIRESGGKGWIEAPIMDFKRAKAAADVWAGRHTLSRHNTSAPDMVFRGFDTRVASPGR